MIAYTSLYFDQPLVPGRAVDIWIPQDKPIQPVAIFFIHGGGWRLGGREQMHVLMSAFFDRGYICVSADYRLGEAPVAVQLADIREGLALTQNHLRRQGIDCPFVLYGSSAGGHLALLCGLAAPGACGDSFQGDRPPIAGIVTSCAPVRFEPWDEIFPGSWESMQIAAGCAYADDPGVYRQLSPERYVANDSPPLFFILADCEHMFPTGQAVELVAQTQAAGGTANYRIYPQAEHGFFYAVQRKSQQLAFQDMLAFVALVSASEDPTLRKNARLENSGCETMLDSEMVY